MEAIPEISSCLQSQKEKDKSQTNDEILRPSLDVNASLRRKPHVSRRRQPLAQKSLHVRFDDHVTVNEYDNGEESALSEDELNRKQKVFENMFKDDTNQESEIQESSYEWAQKSALRLAASVKAASKRLSWFQRDNSSANSQDFKDDSVDKEEISDASNLNLKRNSESDEELDSDSDSKFKIVYRRSTRQRIRKFSMPNVDKNWQSFNASASSDLLKTSDKSRTDVNALLDHNIVPKSTTATRYNKARRFSAVNSLDELTSPSTFDRNGNNIFNFSLFSFFSHRSLK